MSEQDQKDDLAWKLMAAKQRIINAMALPTVLTTSFGLQSVVMLHLATRLNPTIPVVFVDTGYLFAETYRYAEKLKNEMNLNLHVYQAERSRAWEEALVGRPWEGGAAMIQRFNQRRKLEPMKRALDELGSPRVLTGLRRAQEPTRAGLNIREIHRDIEYVNAIVDWTDSDVSNYVIDHKLPMHPLSLRGYRSVGDEGLTTMDSRHLGLFRECGLHPFIKEQRA